MTELTQAQLREAVTIEKIQFSVLSSADVAALSQCEITTPTGMKGVTNTAYDHRLGVIDHAMKCRTCLQTTQNCPGHFGHISLPIGVYNRTFLRFTIQILQSVCHNCSGLRVRREQLATIGKGGAHQDRTHRMKLIVDHSTKYTTCPHEGCGVPLRKVSAGDRGGVKISTRGGRSLPLTATDAHRILSGISTEDVIALGFAGSRSRGQRNRGLSFRPEDLIIKDLIVIPPSARPYIVRDGISGDDDITTAYDLIIRICRKIRGTSRPEGYVPSSMDHMKHSLELQTAIWELMNNKDEGTAKSVSSQGTTGGPIGNTANSSSRRATGIEQRIGSKNGRVQSNVVGKRVDFSARSVIVGGGTMLRDDELGVPHRVARILTKEEIAGEWNIGYLQNLVRECKVNRVNRDGRPFRVEALPDPSRFRLEIGDVVHRHLRDGDVVIFNRQPSLRVESFMAFRVKLIDGFAFRLGLAWTASFNADFDGETFRFRVR